MELPFSYELLTGTWHAEKDGEAIEYIFDEIKCAIVRYNAAGEVTDLMTYSCAVTENSIAFSHRFLGVVLKEMSGCIVQSGEELTLKLSNEKETLTLKKVSNSTEIPEEPEPTPTPATNLITATIKSKTYEVTDSAEGTLTLTAEKKPVAGDVVTAQIEGHYLKVSAANIKGEQILYLPDGVFTYTYASNASVYMPSTFINKPMSFTFSIPTAEELTTRRNLARNSFDATSKTVGFPHAKSNNIYDTSGQFIERNAIDGYSSNKGHGNYPYESWGPKATVKSTDYFLIDFGREVTLDEVVLYLRADGFGGSNSHDAYFSTIVFEFSDGTSVTVNPVKDAKAQSFTFDAVKTSSLRLTGFVTDKSGSQGWAAITEIEAYGADILDAA